MVGTDYTQLEPIAKVKSRWTQLFCRWPLPGNRLLRQTILCR